MSSPRLRIARHTDNLEPLVAFYRDQARFVHTGGFSGHDGYDGAFLTIPGANSELELTTGGEHAAPPPHPESLIVLYFVDEAERAAAAARFTADPVTPANPYWRAHAIAFADPDGFQVLLAIR